jgi:hypothetical protein
MPDHATLSTSQRPLIHSSEDSLRDTEETPIVVDLSASIGNIRNYLLDLQETVQDALEIGSSIEISRISAIRYSWHEKETKRFFLLISRLRLLEQLYTLRKRDEIVLLLEKYPPLSSLLLETHRHIVPYFPGTRFFLETVIDPEADDELQVTDDSVSIVISVETHLGPREALDRLKQFYKDWWLNTPNQAKIKNKISFNLECV